VNSIAPTNDSNRLSACRPLLLLLLLLLSFLQSIIGIPTVTAALTPAEAGTRLSDP